ncbi:2Fe-2S iron-sulfur cluster-binding protein [Rhizobium puerariae]|uniref:2Fe-2S iron-sulfur cluster-binding protein n=1 Tax=Rhizobium puerariae TaxID=1585791 RepID=A0ABV6AJ45_9HYPH
MTTIVFRQPDGSERLIEAEAGTSVMQAAILNGVEGIVGECGGSAMCATCHVHVEEGADGLDAIGDTESEMLDCTASPRDACSRLSCQLFAGQVERIAVRVPERQV